MAISIAVIIVGNINYFRNVKRCKHVWYLHRNIFRFILRPKPLMRSNNYHDHNVDHLQPADQRICIILLHIILLYIQRSFNIYFIPRHDEGKNVINLCP